MNKYTAPAFQESAFNCPHCGAFAQMQWAPLAVVQKAIHITRVHLAHCTRCDAESVWWADQQATFGDMVYPQLSLTPLPHEDMPPEVMADYDEARAIATASPRGAAALLRVAIEKLCAALQAEGKNINEQIGSLVRCGLPVQIQQALDAVRVIGNNAVHPGKMDPADVAAIANSLFALVNLIVEDRITRPKMVEAVFASLPSGARTAIEERDAVK